MGIRISLFLGLISLVMVAIAENGRIPIDNPATHLELTMVHEAMILEYSGRHLALVEAAAMLKLLLYVSLIAAIFVPWGMAVGPVAGGALALGLGTYAIKLGGGAVLLGVFETSIAKMRVFRYGEFLGAAFLLGILAAYFFYISQVL
ncbi:MAG TPA: NADH-quinone oxidoreductase subunit H [Stellaceae bacterium]|nr:NADH-quinone oxidoreductase subunit H [Stellaceae bacterium]